MVNDRKKKNTKIENDDRRCRRAWKKHPGVSPKNHPGKTVGGYSPQKILLRASKRDQLG